MRILGARIFLSLLAGKLEKFEQRLPWGKPRPKNYQSFKCKTNLIHDS